jgi:ferredoxin--NADP+ reductase
MAEWINAKVKQVKNWTPNLFSIKVNAPIAPFSAGQFAKLALEIDGRRVQRAYSYVNPPNNPDLEFYLVNVPTGILSPRLRKVKVGEILSISKYASGFFSLDDIPQCETLWMMSTGTAIGPYLSILQEKNGLDKFDKIILIHAVRFTHDLNYLNLIEKLKYDYNGRLQVQIIISRESIRGSLKGRVPNLLENGILEDSVKFNLRVETSQVMICGNPDMVRQTKKLLERKYKMLKNTPTSRGHVTTENYW